MNIGKILGKIAINLLKTSALIITSTAISAQIRVTSAQTKETIQQGCRSLKNAKLLHRA